MANISRNAGIMLKRTCILNGRRDSGLLNNSLPRLLSTEIVSDIEDPTALIEAKRNKSRLRVKHYKEIHGVLPVDPENPAFPYQQSVPFRRKLIAKYGQSTGINPAIAWPDKEELQKLIEYENVAYPVPLLEVIEQNRRNREEQKRVLLEREKDIETKVIKLDGWIKELKARQNKKLADAKLAQEKKDALIEEVRQHFGYLVSMKDPKFQEMLELKEKEMKKASKEAKRKTKQEKELNRIIETAAKIET